MKTRSAASAPLRARVPVHYHWPTLARSARACATPIFTAHLSPVGPCAPGHSSPHSLREPSNTKHVACQVQEFGRHVLNSFSANCLPRSRCFEHPRIRSTAWGNYPAMCEISPTQAPSASFYGPRCSGSGGTCPGTPLTHVPPREQCDLGGRLRSCHRHATSRRVGHCRDSSESDPSPAFGEFGKYDEHGPADTEMSKAPCPRTGKRSLKRGVPPPFQGLADNLPSPISPAAQSKRKGVSPWVI